MSLIVTSIRFALVVALLGYLAHKVRRVHLMLYEVRSSIRSSLDMLWRRVLAYHALCARLDLRKACPPLIAGARCRICCSNSPTARCATGRAASWNVAAAPRPWCWRAAFR